MRPEVLEFLRCPANLTPLRHGEPELVERLNAAIKQGKLKNAAGMAIAQPLECVLVREDGQVAYAVIQGIPQLLADEGIPLDQAV